MTAAITFDCFVRCVLSDTTEADRADEEARKRICKVRDENDQLVEKTRRTISVRRIYIDDVKHHASSKKSVQVDHSAVERERQRIISEMMYKDADTRKMINKKMKSSKQADVDFIKEYFERIALDAEEHVKRVQCEVDQTFKSLRITRVSRNVRTVKNSEQHTVEEAQKRATLSRQTRSYTRDNEVRDERATKEVRTFCNDSVTYSVVAQVKSVFDRCDNADAEVLQSNASREDVTLLLMSACKMSRDEAESVLTTLDYCKLVSHKERLMSAEQLLDYEEEKNATRREALHRRFVSKSYYKI
jgi:hypothetical protein